MKHIMCINVTVEEHQMSVSQLLPVSIRDGEPFKSITLFYCTR